MASVVAVASLTQLLPRRQLRLRLRRREVAEDVVVAVDAVHQADVVVGATLHLHNAQPLPAQKSPSTSKPVA